MTARPSPLSAASRTLSLIALLLAGCGETGGSPQEAASREGPGLEFFNHLSGILRIELTEPTQPIVPNLLNEKAPTTAKMKSLRLEMHVWVNEDYRELTEAELSQVVLRASTIRLRGADGVIVEHQAPNRSHFTVRDMWRAVEETERRTRDRTEWFGGIDLHHIFFEGIHRKDDGTWRISWGS